MQIIVAEPNGFCAGVDRAIQIVELAIEKYGPPIYVRHKIVHNDHVVNRLKEMGAIFVKSVDNVPDNSVIITSAHGVSKSVIQKIRDRNLHYIDATCPLVTKVHNQVNRANAKGEQIIFIGDPKHPEAIGTCGQANGEVQIVQNENDIDKIHEYDGMSVVTQTTLSASYVKNMIERILQKFPNISLPKNKDICYATENRQRAVIEIAKNVDYFFIFGSTESSNSRHLVETARQHGCNNSFLISSGNDINLENININICQSIGISAGASCPDDIIDDFIAKCKRTYQKVNLETIRYAEESIMFKVPIELRQ